jgi:peptidoglycan hydrolase CwlO-like protein
MTQQSSQQRLLALATVAIIALLGLSAFLIYNKVNMDKLYKKQSAELIEETRLKAELEKEYYEALSDLEEMRGSNTELNAMIETQKEELKKAKSRIDALMKDSKDLGKAQEEIKRLRALVAEVEQLKQQNAELQAANTQLTGERDELVLVVEQQKVTNEQLSTEKANLSSANEQLSQQNQNLSSKVNVASAVKVNNITAVGYKVKGSGKEADTKKAKTIDGVRVCFMTTSNDIVPDGQEEFYLRIIDPLGQVMAIQDLGSGNFKVGNSNETMQYTQRVRVDYAQEPKEGCFNWQPGVAFATGTYTVEVFNKGFMSGKGSFTLK